MLHPPQDDKTFCVDVSYFVQLVQYLEKLIILSSKPGSLRQTLEVNLYQTSMTRGFGNLFFLVDILPHKNTCKWYKPGGTFAGHLRPFAGQFGRHSTKRDPPTSLETTLKQGIKEPCPRSKGILPCNGPWIIPLVGAISRRLIWNFL